MVPVPKPLFHSSQKSTRKLAATAFKYCDWMKVLAASLRVGFCDEWKRALKLSAGRSNFQNISNSCRPEVDLVFVHGLRGSPFRTWRSRTKGTVEGRHTDCWPRV